MLVDTSTLKATNIGTYNSSWYTKPSFVTTLVSEYSFCSMTPTVADVKWSDTTQSEGRR